MCFSLQFFEQLLIWCVIIGAIFALVRLLLPMATAQMGPPGGVILSVLNIILYAVIAIFVIYICFELISCLVGSGGLSLPRPR